MKYYALAKTKDAFNAFRVESIWVKTVHDTFAVLYHSTPETSELLHRTAPLFFSDLNSMYVEYWILVVCRLTDRAKTMGRENLTVKNLLDDLKQFGLLTDSIQKEADGLQSYRDLLDNARNRAVSHADKATFLNPEVLGEHRNEQLNEFLDHLQKFNDLVGEVLGEGPMDFSGTSAPGDVNDLLKALANRT